MNNEINSKALEVNLKNTNVEYVIPEEHQWFIKQSENQWGLHKRVVEFFTEYDHPMSNRTEVVKALPNVTISDFWLYKELPIEDQKRIVDIVLAIYDKLLGEKLPHAKAKDLVTYFLRFIDGNDSVLNACGDGVKRCIQILDKYLDDNAFSYYCHIGQFKVKLAKAANNPDTADITFKMMQRLVKSHIQYWRETTQIMQWYEDHKAKMSRDYSQELESLGDKMFDEFVSLADNAKNWQELCDNAFTFGDIIKAFQNKIYTFEHTSEQFSYIFYLLHLPGTVDNHPQLLVELNKVIKHVSNEKDEDLCIASIDNLFEQFADFRDSHLNLILDSIFELGKEIIHTDNHRLIHHLEKKIINFGFVTPGVKYVTNDWELKVNPCHIKNVRVWLELVELAPETMQRLLSALIINLRLGGIFVFDTDFFQKDITKLLNSEISPVYKQTKQLARIFPVYFNEIGAEGQLRDVSTKIDELSHRNDKLIHFLRKQIHTEGNNSHIQITLDVINFWYDRQKERWQIHRICADSRARRPPKCRGLPPTHRR